MFDSKLNKNPDELYPEWDGWSKFNSGRLTIYVGCSNALSAAFRLGLTDKSSYQDYADVYQTVIGGRSLPKKPHIQYGLIDFDAFLNFKVWGTERINQFTIENKIDSIAHYRAYQNENSYLPIYRTSHGINLYKPSRCEDFKKIGFEQWSKLAEDFAHKRGVNISHTEAHLAKFLTINTVNHYLTEYPALYFLNEHKKPTIDNLVKSFETPKASQKFISILKAFLDFVMDRECYDIDDETGDKTLLDPRFKHPYKNEVIDLSSGNTNRSESVKPVLPIKYINAAKRYLVSDEANHFSDLKNSIELNEDWFEVEQNMIDEADPDCVWRTRNIDRKGFIYEIWAPVKTLAMYMLFSTPLRGQQILWLDSGEADNEKLVYKNKIECNWEKNDNALAGQLKNQGVLKKTREGAIDMHITTNKTSNIEGSYDVPYCPEDLAYWLVKLRDWQSKYNPLKEPLKWSKLTHKSKISTRALIQRGKQCFLFRTPINSSKAEHNNYVSQPPITSGVFATRLPKLLYQIQDNPELPLARLIGRRYESDYTPHSLRVSQITYLIFEAKISPLIVAKLVGHTNIIMTIYYAKAGHTHIRQELELAELNKQSLEQNQLEKMIIDRKIQEVKAGLVFNGFEQNPILDEKWPRASICFLDYGICPAGQIQCITGGNDGTAVVAGYLGTSNCIRCRYFVTSPAYLAGLVNLNNEISLAASVSKEQLTELREEAESLKDAIYDFKALNKPVGDLERKLLRINNGIEAEDPTLINLLSDQISCMRLIKDCMDILNNQSSENMDDSTSLVVNNTQDSWGFEINECSELRHLSEVCEGAELFLSGKANSAAVRRSQIFDAMLSNNGIKPFLFQLSQKQQLKVGNQMINLCKLRLQGIGHGKSLTQTWELIDDFAQNKKRFDFIEDGQENSQLTRLSHELKYLSEHQELPDSALENKDK